MSRSNWQIFLGIILLVLSTVGYIIHYLIFRDAHHIFIFLVGGCCLCLYRGPYGDFSYP